MLIIDQLREYNAFSEAEKSVALKLIELQDKIENMSIRELAKVAYVSTSAITRLCSKLGFDGFNDFKKEYLEEIRYENSHFSSIDANFPFDKNDNLVKVSSNLSTLYQETCKDTLSLVNYFELIKAVKLISEAENVYVLCIGSSIEIGKIFAERMIRLGKKVIADNNVNKQFFQAYGSSPKDCFIVITYSGTTVKTRQYIDEIHRNQAKLILLTSLGQNEIKKYADAILTLTTRERLYSNITTYTSTLSTMFLMDLIYSVYFQTRYDEHIEYKKTLAIKYEPNRKPSHKAMEEEENTVFKPKEQKIP